MSNRKKEWKPFKKEGEKHATLDQKSSPTFLHSSNRVDEGEVNHHSCMRSGCRMHIHKCMMYNDRKIIHAERRRTYVHMAS